MHTLIKVILWILIVLLLVSIGGVVLKLFIQVAWFMLQLVVGALVVLFIIWLINRVARGRT